MTDIPGLIADIGATNARFALADDQGVHNEQVLKCADYPGIIEAVQVYLDNTGLPRSPSNASFAVAGAVIGDRLKMVNHPWEFSISDTQNKLGFENFMVINDFKAVALSIPHLKPEDVQQLGPGAPKKDAPIGVIGPGTGLGVASLFWDGNRYQSVPGEGGHVTMPARTQREFDIFRTLRYKYRHVSAERVCSGKGLANIYDALRILDGHDERPSRTPEEISAAALNDECALCSEALTLMMRFLGRVAGNLALTLGAHGGIYIGGGIIHQLGERFLESEFRTEFQSKGRMEEYLAPIPTYIIRHPYPAFVGLYAELKEKADT